MKKFKSIIVLVTVCALLTACGQTKQTDSASNGDDTTLSIDQYSGQSKIFLGMITPDSIHIVASREYLGDDTLYSDFKVFKGNAIIHHDTSNHFSIDRKKCFIKRVESTNYIFLSMVDIPFEDKWQVLEVRQDGVTLHANILKNIFADINRDGYYEVGGKHVTDAVCIDCDSVLYSPYLVYSLRDRLEFDSVLSRKLTMETYGVFLGFEVVYDTIITKLKDPLNN